MYLYYFYDSLSALLVKRSFSSRWLYISSVAMPVVNCSLRFPCSCLSILRQSDQLSSSLVLQLEIYSFTDEVLFFLALTHLDPIAVDTIRSRDLPVWYFTNSFFNFYCSYITILLLVAVHLFCYFLNPICIFSVFYIFLPYSRPEFSSFLLTRYYILFMWLSIQFLIELRLVRLEQPVLPILFYSVLTSL